MARKMDKKVTYETNQKVFERNSLRKRLMELKARKVSSDSQTNSSEYDGSLDEVSGLESLEVGYAEAGLNPEELAGYINQMMSDLEKEEEESGEKQPIMLQIPFFLGQ